MQLVALFPQGSLGRINSLPRALPAGLGRHSITDSHNCCYSSSVRCTLHYATREYFQPPRASLPLPRSLITVPEVVTPHTV